MRHYSYKIKNALPFYVQMWICILTCIAVGATIIRTQPAGTWNFAVLIYPFIGAIFFLFVMFLRIWSARPIGVDKIGVSTYFLGYRTHIVEWKAINGVEIFHFYSRTQQKNRRRIVLRSNQSEIRFNDEISHFRDLVATLNEYVREGQIRVVETEGGKKANLSEIPAWNR